MPRTVRRTVRLHAAQQAFRRSDALFRGFTGGRGSGKSWAGAYDLIRRARRGHTYLVASPTGIKLADETYPTLRAVALSLGVWDQAAVRLTPYPTATLTTGATVRFRTAEDPARLAGPNLSGVWLDEAGLMSEDAYTVTIGCLREHGEQGRLSATFTPRGPSHWTYRVFGPGNPDAALFRARTRDNPFLPPGFADTLARQYGGEGSLLGRQELGGEFVTLEGAEWPADYFADIGYDELPPGLPVRWRLLALDPSKGSKSRLGDFSAWSDAVLDRRGHLWDRPTLLVVPTTEVEDQTVALLKARRYDGLIVECNGFQEVLADNIARKCAALGVHCPLYKHVSTENKTVRIRMDLTPMLSQHRMHLDATSPHYPLALGQLMEFPRGAHDDYCDALSLLTVLCNHLLTGTK